jgi:hypothetical protein
MESLFGRDFASPEDARVAIDAAAQQAGYSFTKHRSRPNSVEFRCSKGRNFKSQQNPDLPESRRRQTSSQMTGCPFKLVVSRQHPLAPWVIRRTRNDESNEHNHPAFPSAAHCRYRNMAIEKRKEKIVSLFDAGVKPMQILKQLQLETECHAEGLTRYDVYNAIRKYRLQQVSNETLGVCRLQYNSLSSQDNIQLGAATRNNSSMLVTTWTGFSPTATMRKRR